MLRLFPLVSLSSRQFPSVSAALTVVRLGSSVKEGRSQPTGRQLNQSSSRRSNDANHDRGKSSRPPRHSAIERRGPPREYNNREFKRPEKLEPSWGHYDGDLVFGVSPVNMALVADRREIDELFVQEGMDTANKKDKTAASRILQMAEEKGVPVRHFSKGDLNMMTDNKVHQGFVLRAAPLEFEKVTHLEPSGNFSCVLALDEVWDPMNFGALVRTSHFLGCDKVVICAKNSAPLSPTVSKASAGALEVMPIHSTDNLMKFLDKSVENGWRVVGTDLSPESVALSELPRTRQPTILVLGNEGHGLRTNIKRRCTSLVRIGKASVVDDSGEEATEDGVDSLNVSVTGGILLHHLLAGRN